MPCTTGASADVPSAGVTSVAVPSGRSGSRRSVRSASGMFGSRGVAMAVPYPGKGRTTPGRERPSKAGPEAAAKPGRQAAASSPKASAAAEVAVTRQRDFGLLELLDVDVFERQDPYVLHESGRAVHVPHPRVGHLHLEVDLAVGVAYVQVHVVGEVEAPLGLHHVRELPDDVAVLAIELQLHLGLVLLKILGTHVPASLRATS